MPQTRPKPMPIPNAGVQKPHAHKAPFKGRPVYTDEDRKKMRPAMPSEEDWVNELLGSNEH
jgi:hypothetical protein